MGTLYYKFDVGGLSSTAPAVTSLKQKMEFITSGLLFRTTYRYLRETLKAILHEQPFYTPSKYRVKFFT